MAFNGPVLLDTLTSHLNQLEATDLADLLARRPDVVLGVPPVDLGEVAERLVDPYSLASAARTMPLAALQVLEAALALGDGCRVEDLVAFLRGGAEHATVVDSILDELQSAAIVLRTGATLALPESLRELIPDPLGLGPSMATLLADRTVDQMRRVATGLGLPTQKNRADTVQALLEHFADPVRVQALIQEVPAEVRDTLLDMGAEDWSDRAWRARKAAVEWAEPRGLLIQSGYSHLWQMPSEVVRALRGTGYAAPFTPVPPVIATRAPQPATVERESSAAATVFAAGLLALLDHLARTPVATLKSGGLGARELARLGKVLGTDERTLRLALELADDCDLLDALDGTVTVSADFAAWRDAEPEVQFAAVVEAWWSLGSTPTEARDVDDKPRRVLVGRDLYCEGCLLARQAMIVVLDRLGATDRASLLAQLRWWHPAVHASPEDAPLTDQWAEAELLGVIADGAVSDLGRALLPDSDGPSRLADVARGMLPATAQHATFGSDLTAFVAGTPAGRVTSVLDAAADREGRGGAITWRFSAPSVRRAFDDDATPDHLLAELAAVSQTDLPQPLRYLIADVARRHGHLRLAGATAVVCSDDPALLTLVAADRKLAKYGLRLLAPTVLAADVDVDILLSALRTAGYFPVRDATAPVPATDQPGAPSDAIALRAAIKAWGRENGLAVGSPEPVGEPLDLLELAGRLKAGGPPRATGKTMTERVLGRLNRALSTAELRQLAHAIDSGGSIGIVYAASSGGVTERVISEIELMGTSVSAWCELRSDDREFLVSRIRSVFSVR